MIDVKALLEEIKASPYETHEVRAPHTGMVNFEISKPGARVVGPSEDGKPGTKVAVLEREHNAKAIGAPLKGEIATVNGDVAGKFVEAGTKLFTIRHYLPGDEVIQAILKKTLYLFNAPERAAYYFVPEADAKIKKSGPQSVSVNDGDDLFIVSKMKRETSLSYSGPAGTIYAVYFKPNQSVDEGKPLIGVCPTDQLSLIKDVVGRVKAEWVEPTD